MTKNSRINQEHDKKKKITRQNVIKAALTYESEDRDDKVRGKSIAVCVTVIVLLVMLLFPFFPDDMLCMAAGLTKMTFKFFIIAVVLTRPVMIAFVSYFGTGKIIPFSGWGIPVWISMFVFMVALLYLLNYFIKKRKRRGENTTSEDE